MIVRARPARLAAAVLAAALPLAACGSSAHPATHAAPRGAAPPPGPARPVGHRIGITQRVRARGATLAVRVSQVIDPLRGSGAALLPGTRVIGIVVRIGNRGPGEYDSSSTGDVSAVPSAGTASGTFVSRGRCATQDRDFDNQLSAGTTVEGCVAFALAQRARLLAVRFSADAGGAGSATWAGPGS